MNRKKAQLLAGALKKNFGGKVEFETTNGHGRFRFAITSKKFTGKPQLRRQDAVWKIVDEILPREDALDVSLILAFSPEELKA